MNRKRTYFAEVSFKIFICLLGIRERCFVGVDLEVEVIIGILDFLVIGVVVIFFVFFLTLVFILIFSVLLRVLKARGSSSSEEKSEVFLFEDAEKIIVIYYLRFINK